MRTILFATVALVVATGAVYAQGSDKPMNSQKHAPGTVGAMKNSSADGVATDPEQVKAQQQGTSKSSPGTVGAAPGADAPSSNPHH